MLGLLEIFLKHTRARAHAHMRTHARTRAHTHTHTHKHRKDFLHLQKYHSSFFIFLLLFFLKSFEFQYIYDFQTNSMY